MLRATYTGEPHRKWAWADEKAWNMQVDVPMIKQYGLDDRKYSGNPILVPEDFGAQASTGINVMSVLRPEDKWWMYISGRDASNYWSAFLATANSPDTDVHFAPYNSGNPILTATQAWEAGHVFGLHAVRDTYDTDKRFKALYGGGIGGTGGIGYAYSADGKAWTKYAGNPVWTTEVHAYPALALIQVGQLFVCIFRNTSSDLQMITSGDCINWTDRGTILSRGEVGEWDASLLGYPALYHNSGILYLSYQGTDSGNNRRAGLAMASIADITSWTKSFNNPISQPSQSWERSNPTPYWSPGVFQRLEDIFPVWYTTKRTTPNIWNVIAVTWFK